MDELTLSANAKLVQAETNYQLMKADAKTAIETANTAIETAKGISSAIDNFCGNSGTCEVLGLPDYQTPDYFDFDSEDYKWEIDAVDLADLGIDGSLPELSSGKTLDEIQAPTPTLTLTRSAPTNGC